MVEKKVQEYNYYLFDADGTLFDTTEMIVRCFQNTARVYDLAMPDRSGIVSNIGMTLRRQMECYFGAISDDVFGKYRETHMDYQLKIYKEHLKLCPGVSEALHCLGERGKPCAVVTSRMPETLTVYLKETGIFSCFRELITPVSTKRHKPDPEPAFAALHALGGSPGKALFIGDSTFDIECGAGAGVATAFVTWSHNSIDSLRQAPSYIISDMREICAW